MITKKEAKERIKRWNGLYNQTTHIREDGFEFIKTDLYYEKTVFFETRQDIQNRNRYLFNSTTSPQFQQEIQQVIVDSFIHPK